MNELPVDEIVDLFVRVILPLFTLVVLWFGLRVSYRTLVRSITPQIECFLRPCSDGQVFELVVANYGLGCAYNVSIDLEVDEDDFEAHQVVMKWRTTEIPFDIIEPGGSITTLFGMGHLLLGSEPHLKPFHAVIRYQWQPFWTKRPKRVNRRYKLDVRQFTGLAHIIEKNEIAETLKSELKKIADIIKKPPPRPPIPRDRRCEDPITLDRMESLMPSLFTEMREDLNSYPLKREFILKSEGWSINTGKKEPLEYYYESHENLTDKVGLLVSEGLVTDITYNSIDRYVMSEPLVQYLLDVHGEEEKF